jgi:hypothetical protein
MISPQAEKNPRGDTGRRDFLLLRVNGLDIKVDSETKLLHEEPDGEYN